MAAKPFCPPRGIPTTSQILQDMDLAKERQLINEELEKEVQNWWDVELKCCQDFQNRQGSEAKLVIGTIYIVRLFSLADKRCVLKIGSALGVDVTPHIAHTLSWAICAETYPDSTLLCSEAMNMVKTIKKWMDPKDVDSADRKWTYESWVPVRKTLSQLDAVLRSAKELAPSLLLIPVVWTNSRMPSLEESQALLQTKHALMCKTLSISTPEEVHKTLMEQCQSKTNFKGRFQVLYRNEIKSLGKDVIIAKLS